MVIEDFPDRVQVTIEHSGECKPTAGLDTFVGGGSKDGSRRGKSAHSLQDTRVDRVQYDTHEGRSRMTLIKYRDATQAQTSSSAPAQTFPSNGDSQSPHVLHRNGENFARLISAPSWASLTGASTFKRSPAGTTLTPSSTFARVGIGLRLLIALVHQARLETLRRADWRHPLNCTQLETSHSRRYPRPR